MTFSAQSLPKCGSTDFTGGMGSPAHMRAEVALSWERSAAAGVPVDAVDAPITVPEGSLSDYRQAHPLARIFPLLDDILGQAARDCDSIMAISDAAGQLLWVAGRPSVLRAAERIGFVEGSNWDERLAGTNAPGMALALDTTATVIGAEHFRHSVQRWSCAATPIHDPHSSALLGVLDLTGGEDVVTPATVALVRAAARLAESELARELLSPIAAVEHSDGALALVLDVLGRHEALLTIRAPGRSPQTLRLSPRHSEIVLLLASAPAGLSGDELAALVYEDDGGDSTLRAELNRLKNLLGPDLLKSRPYRLRGAVTGDWLGVHGRLTAGDLAGALRHFKGPILPRSEAPGVVRLREVATQGLRHALLSSREVAWLSTWTRSHWGSDDYEMWQAQAKLLPTGSPLRALVSGQLARLDRELGTATWTQHSRS